MNNKEIVDAFFDQNPWKWTIKSPDFFPELINRDGGPIILWNTRFYVSMEELLALAAEYQRLAKENAELGEELEKSNLVVDKVLDNRNEGMQCGDSYLWYRLEELVDYYQRLKSEKEELKIRIAALESELKEEEGRANLHANLNREVAQALGLSFGTSWHDLPERVERLISHIADLEKKQKWMPVIERLPEETKTYQVTVKFQNVKISHNEVRNAHYYANDRGGGEWDEDDIPYRCKIIAWRELPDPYVDGK